MQGHLRILFPVAKMTASYYYLLPRLDLREYRYLLMGLLKVSIPPTRCPLLSRPAALRDQSFLFSFFSFMKKISGQNENDHAGLLDHPFEFL